MSQTCLHHGNVGHDIVDVLFMSAAISFQAPSSKTVAVAFNMGASSSRESPVDEAMRTQFFLTVFEYSFLWIPFMHGNFHHVRTALTAVQQIQQMQQMQMQQMQALQSLLSLLSLHQLMAKLHSLLSLLKLRRQIGGTRALAHAGSVARRATFEVAFATKWNASLGSVVLFFICRGFSPKQEGFSPKQEG